MSDNKVHCADTAPGHYGVAGTARLSLRETTLTAAWNLQGKPSNAQFMEQVRLLFGVCLPLAVNTAVDTDMLSAIWLGPASWLLLSGRPLSADHPLTNITAKRDAANALGGALFDVSNSRAAWTLCGPRAATVLSSACPLDFHQRAFPDASCAQSLFGRTNALFYRRVKGDFTMFVARSFARDVWSTLCLASAQHGYEVREAAPFA